MLDETGLDLRLVEDLELRLDDDLELKLDDLETLLEGLEIRLESRTEEFIRDESKVGLGDRLEERVCFVSFSESESELNLNRFFRLDADDVTAGRTVATFLAAVVSSSLSSDVSINSLLGGGFSAAF